MSVVVFCHYNFGRHVAFRLHYNFFNPLLRYKSRAPVGWLLGRLIDLALIGRLNDLAFVGRLIDLAVIGLLIDLALIGRLTDLAGLA